MVRSGDVGTDSSDSAYSFSIGGGTVAKDVISGIGKSIKELSLVSSCVAVTALRVSLV